MIPFRSKSVTLSMLIDLLTRRCRLTQVKLYTGLIASIDLWPQEMFTFSEMLALVQSESSFGAYVSLTFRRPAGLQSDQRSSVCICCMQDHRSRPLRFSIQLPFLFFFFSYPFYDCTKLKSTHHKQLSALILCTLHHEFTLAIEKIHDPQQRWRLEI